MSRPRVLVVVPLVVLGVLGLGGCRGADRAASPAPAPHSAVPRSAASAPDPLAGIESSVDAVERDVDADSRSDAGAADASGSRAGRADSGSDSSAGR
jgi:hypothetical protein